jgi:hypothetical protein
VRIGSEGIVSLSLFWRSPSPLWSRGVGACHSPPSPNSLPPPPPLGPASVFAGAVRTLLSQMVGKYPRQHWKRRSLVLQYKYSTTTISPPSPLSGSLSTMPSPIAPHQPMRNICRIAQSSSSRSSASKKSLFFLARASASERKSGRLPWPTVLLRT